MKIGPMVGMLICGLLPLSVMGQDITGTNMTLTGTATITGTGVSSISGSLVVGGTLTVSGSYNPAQVGVDGTAAFFQTLSNEAIQFRPNSSTAMTITGTGYAGIGTSTPAYKLDVQGGAINIRSSAANTDTVLAFTSSGPGAGAQTQFIVNLGYTKMTTWNGGATITPLYIDNRTGAMAINTNLIYGMLEVLDTSTFPAGYFERATGNAASNSSVLVLQANANSNSISNDYGPGLYYKIKNSSGTQFQIAYIGAGRDGADTSGSLAFDTSLSGSMTEKARITSSGSFGIGTTTPSAKLEVNGTAKVDGAVTATGTMTVAPGGNIPTYTGH